MRLENARAQVERLERELMETSILNPNKPITREAFLDAQCVISRPRGGPEICHGPHHSRGNSCENIAVAHYEHEEVEFKGVDIDNEPLSEDLFPGHKHNEHVFHIKMLEERSRLENEFKLKEDRYQTSIDELRHKRICDRERYRDKVAELERMIAEVNGACETHEQTCNSYKKENVMLNSTIRELKTENTRLLSDIERLEERVDAERQRVPQLEGRYKAEIGSYNRKIVELEELLTESKDTVSKLRTKNESILKKLDCLEKHNSSVEQDLACNKATTTTSINELNRMTKRLTQVEEEFETSSRNFQLTIQELEHQNHTLTDLLNTRENEVISCRQKVDDMDTQLLTYAQQLRTLENVTELYDTAKLRANALTIETNKLKAELNRLSTDYDGMYKKMTFHQTRAEESIDELNKLRKKMDVLRASSLNSASACCSRIQQQGEDLIDGDGDRISRLGRGNALARSQMNSDSRPAWWFESTEPVINRSRVHAFVDQPSSAEYCVHRPFRPDIHLHVDNEDEEYEQTLASMYIAEKKDIQNRMSQMSPNPAYRTTDENEEHDSLAKRLSEISSEMQNLKLG